MSEGEQLANSTCGELKLNQHEFDDLEDNYSQRMKEQEVARFLGIEDLHQIGAKDDRNKPRLDLVLGDFAYALWGVGLVGTFGAKKYTDKGWHEVDNGIERYSNALLRHYFNFKSGEMDDKESNLPHLAHLAWNALAILQLYMEEKNANRKEKSTTLTIEKSESKIFQPGSIYEVAVDHPDFKSIQKLQEGHDKFICKYKYDCDYKEDNK